VAVAIPGLVGGGQVLPLRIHRVRATGNTVAAGAIIALL
jgi:hypothetical protein